MINGVLVERTVEDVVPVLKIHSEGLKKALEDLVKQYKSKQDEMEKWKVCFALISIIYGRAVDIHRDYFVRSSVWSSANFSTEKEQYPSGSAVENWWKQINAGGLRPYGKSHQALAQCHMASSSRTLSEVR